MSAVLGFRNLSLGYGQRPVVSHVDGDIPVGSLTAVVGPNGAGKSTLLKGVMGLLPPMEGRVDLAGLSRASVAYLPQQSDIDRSFPITVMDLVAMGLWREIGPFGGLSRRQRDRICDAIAAVGLSGFERRPIGALSGGQMQRVLFARLVLQDAKLVLLDEPFTAIDTKTAVDLIEIVKRWHGEGRTVLAVLHDFHVVRAHFPETLLLARDLIAHGSTDAVLTPANLTRARRICEAQDAQASPWERSAA